MRRSFKEGDTHAERITSDDLTDVIRVIDIIFFE